ncbi:putative ankyrin repeat protein RF_0381 [Wyeomyia smithii]|uniref:putative ankyrin repeat protein RF_0381 n=1 Tax=Wyeomyia smithii TaxID=174621 RepID=UPI002467CEBA|nr:putative ankyrin repeat protein RF_0381 [Wyeomyia smithii]XP_055536160.1 putative ankyrin repeat protein RF_0381 [Wyeomyia smithii]
MDSELEWIGFGLFDDDENPTNDVSLQPVDDLDFRQKLLQFKINFYQSSKDGTLLHNWIRKNNKQKIDDLLHAYQLDFNRIRDYLVSKFQWNIGDKILFRKTILVAVDEELCVTAKKLENRQISQEDLSRAVFVLLKVPVEGDEVAVIHPSETNRLEVLQLINKLIPNGYLSWNSTGTERMNETPMEVAAACGNIALIGRLYNMGADIAFHTHSALNAACRHFRENVIFWLLTEHFDDFDCTLRDAQKHNAIMLLMRRKNQVKVFQFVLEKMIAYRQKYYHESESTAFNEIFRAEDKDLSSLSILTYIGKGPILNEIEKYIVKYKFNLSYQWENVTILATMLCRKIALKYCFDEIRINPDLLKLMDYGCITVLHCMVIYGHIDFLREIYALKPESTTYFETDGGIEVLHRALYGGNIDQLQFIFEHHLEFVKSHLEQLREQIVRLNPLDKIKDVLLKYFPELREDVEKACEPEPAYSSLSDIESSFPNIDATLSHNTNPPSSIRGRNGETLLHLAVARDDVALFIKLLELGCDQNAVDNDENHTVHFVRSLDMLNLLIERYPEREVIVQIRNANGCTVLHRVCSRYMEQKSRLSLVERIVECGADVNALTVQGDTALFCLIECGPVNVLLKHNIKLDVVNLDGETALWHQLRKGNVCMANALLPLFNNLPCFKTGAHEFLGLMMNSRNRDFFSCDYQWYLEKHPEVAKFLFDSVYQHSREEASRLFAKACYSAFNFVVEKFLDYNYDLNYNYTDDDGYSPLIGLLSYMEKKNDHLVKRLLEKDGIDLEARNKWGRTALLSITCHFKSAQWYGHSTETVQLLLDHGANINAADCDGNTALHMAFSSSERQLAEVLIRNGADLKAVNRDGKVPYQMGGRIDQELFYFMV